MEEIERGRKKRHLEVDDDLSFMDKEFNYSDYGKQQYQALVHYARSQIDFDERIPIKVTEVNLLEGGALVNSSATHKSQSISYFRLYMQVEQELAQAIQNPSIK